MTGSNLSRRSRKTDDLKNESLLTLDVRADVDEPYQALVRYESWRLRKHLFERTVPIDLLTANYILRNVERHDKRITPHSDLNVSFRRGIHRPMAAHFGGLYELFITLEQHTEVLLYRLQDGDRLCAPADRVSIPGVSSCPALWYEKKPNEQNDCVVLDVEHMKEDYVGSRKNQEIFSLYIIDASNNGLI